MKSALILTVASFGVVTVAHAESGSSYGPHYNAGVEIGYYSGTSVHLHGSISDFSGGFPVGLRGGIGYTTTDPGDAADARRIFINNATNGVPEKDGHIWDFRVDLMRPITMWRSIDSYLLVGPRYTRFVGNFRFIGGNEFFDVTSNAWGLGVGLENRFPMNDRFNLFLSGAFDYFPATSIQGHDTSYSPDNNNVNPREDNTYDDADNAVSQPKYELRFMLGLDFRI